MISMNSKALSLLVVALSFATTFAQEVTTDPFVANQVELGKKITE